MKIRFADFTDIGPRPRQEDSFLCDNDRGLFFVADGLGGHPRGNEASTAAIDAIKALAVAGTPSQLAKWIHAHAQEAVEALACPNETVTPGTTLTGLIFGDSECMLYHIGDSRCYRLRGDRLDKLSVDHSMYGCLTQRLGKPSGDDPEQPEPYIGVVSAVPGDMFLLATDGFYDALSEHRIKASLKAGLKRGEASSAMWYLQSAANAWEDNATAIVIQYCE